MDLIVFSMSEIGFHYIYAPLKLEDYDKYWNMLFKGNYGYCCADSFEEFKQEVIESKEMDAYIIEKTASEFKMMRDLTKEELVTCPTDYNRYFDVKEG